MISDHVIDIAGEIALVEQERSQLYIQIKALRWIRMELKSLAKQAVRSANGDKLTIQEKHIVDRWNKVKERSEDIGFYGLPNNWWNLDTYVDAII